MNDQLVLICGSSGTGKSASLINLDKPEGVIYLNTEAGKKLPFKSKFKEYTITDPPIHIPKGASDGNNEEENQ